MLLIQQRLFLVQLVYVVHSRVVQARQHCLALFAGLHLNTILVSLLQVSFRCWGEGHESVVLVLLGPDETNESDGEHQHQEQNNKDDRAESSVTWTERVLGLAGHAGSGDVLVQCDHNLVLVEVKSSIEIPQEDCSKSVLIILVVDALNSDEAVALSGQLV